MMSLFSPFDYFFFVGTAVFVSMLSTLFGYLVFTITSPKFMLSNLHKNLNSFFFSLDPHLNKMSILLFFSMFFVLFSINLYSVFSYNFPFTSQVSIILLYSLSFWLGIIFWSTVYSFKKMLSHYIPSGSPLLLVPFLFLIELVSNIIRPVTLMVRLVANILAGHLLMILLSSLVFIFPVSLPFYILLNLVELFVSLIQAYIFSTMLVLYFSEK